MNKHFYRIVFNAARGLRMVVQESARSTGKGASRSTRGAAVGATIGLFVALVAAGANAQIIADPNAPANQRPPVLVAPNGVPLVNIQTPTAGGVSRNTYRQFDVDGKGAILNNSRSNVQTQLGGWVQGNPFLGRGPARIILNEVNSSNPSHLRGVVEVAGQRAEVIIANPSGISVDGAGFINAAGVTLTTGTPQFNSAGSLESFLVRGGTITVEGAGLDASNLDYAAILSRALQVNAGIWAKDLKVVTGANEVSADASKATPVAGSGAAPTFALDVAQLGGMYANKIKLIGTEAGVGVRNAGSIGAGAGELVVTSSGRLENRGTLEAARVQLAAATELDNSGGTIRQTGGALTVAAATLSNRNGGVIGAEPVPEPAAASAGEGGAGSAAQGGTAGADGGAVASSEAGGAGSAAAAQPSAPLLPGLITAGETVRNDGGRIHAGDVTLETPQIDNSGGTLAVKQLAVSGERFANNGGTLNVRDTFSAQVGDFDNSGGVLQAGHIDVRSGNAVRNVGGQLLATGGDAALEAVGELDNTDGVIAAANDLQLDAGSMRNGSSDATHSGQLRAGRDLSMHADGAVDNSGSISAARNVTLDAGSYAGRAGSTLAAGAHADGRLNNEGDLNIRAAGTLAAHGTQVAAGNIVAQGSDVDLSAGQTQARNVSLTATQGHVTTRGAAVNAAETLSVTANTQPGQVLDNQGGQLSAAQLKLQAANIDNSHGGRLLQSDASVLQIDTGKLDNSAGGQIVHAGDLRVNAHSVDNREGVIASEADAVRLDAQSLDNRQGQIASQGELALNVATVDNQSGQIGSHAGDVRVTAQSVDNRAGLFSSERELTFDAASVNNRGGQIASQAGGLRLDAQTLDNVAGLITSQTDLALTATSVDNSGGGQVASRTGGLQLNAQTLDNRDGLIAGQTDVALDASNVNNHSGEIVSRAGGLQLNGQTLDNVAGLISSQTDAALDAAKVNNNNGEIVSRAGGVQLSAQALDNVEGLISSETDLALDAAKVNNSSGEIVSRAGGVQLKAQALDNVEGLISSETNLALDAAKLNNSSGEIVSRAGGLQLDAQTLDNAKGLISSQTDLTLEATSVSNNSGQIVSRAGGLQLDAQTLDNVEGLITSQTDLTLDAAKVNNNSGEIVSRAGGLQLDAQALDNRNGLVASQGGELGLDVTAIDNQRGQLLSTAGALRAAADAINNRGGEIAAKGGDVQLDAADEIDNRDGTIVALGGDVRVHTGGLDNSQGVVASQTGALELRSTGATINQGGTLQASQGSVDVTAAQGLDNSQGGLVLGQQVAVDTQGATLDNRQGGVVAGTQSARIDSGTLHNDAGLLQAGEQLTVDTHGQRLGNTQSAAFTNAAVQAPSGGLLSGGELTLRAGEADNRGGVIGAEGVIDAQTASLANTAGAVRAQGINWNAGTGAIDNTGGRVEAEESLALAADSVDNTGGLIRANDALTLAARNAVNRDTLGEDQGIEGNDVQINVASLDNTGGAVRANANASVTASTVVDNSGGVISSRGALSISDTNTTKALTVRNPGGSLLADTDLSIDAATFSADGTLGAGRDLAIALTQDVNNNQDLSASGNLRYATTGNFTNNAKLTAGASLQVAGADLTNTASGEMSGANTAVAASGTLRNRGLINSAGHTAIDAATADNAGTGRIYGDSISVAAQNLFNTAESVGGVSASGTIASRTGDIDLGVAQSIVNADGGYILSGKDLTIGGALDANRFATGRVQQLTNEAATIESVGDMWLGAERLDNLNKGFETGVVTRTEAGGQTYIALTPTGERFLVEELGLCYHCGADREDSGAPFLLRWEYVIPSEQYPYDKGYQRRPYALPGAGGLYANDDPVWALFNVTPGDTAALGVKLFTYNQDFMARAMRTYAIISVAERQITQTEVLNEGVAGRIVSGGNITLDIGTGRNLNSQVIAGGVLGGSVADLEDKGVSGTRQVRERGTWNQVFIDYSDDRPLLQGSGTFDEVVENRSIDVTSASKLEHQTVALAGVDAPAATLGQGSANATAAGLTQGVTTRGSIVEVTLSASAGHTSSASTASDASSASNAGANNASDASAASDLAATSGEAASSTNASASVPRVVRTTAPNTRVPSTSLFSQAPGARYLVETDPRFTNYRQWLTSDYLLDQLGLDPAATQKRLGDGFYEQRLINEQVAKLTGHRFISGYANDEEQYKALMTNGATFAKQFQLTPGVALTAAQMAQLTSDIVWLVAQSVTLPDGSTQTALVPQVYVRVQPGDIDGQGALLSGNSVDLTLSGDLTNSGTIAGREAVKITADNVRNIDGGRITGADVTVTAKTDLDVIGARIDAGNSLSASAGRDLNVRSTTISDSSNTGTYASSHTRLDRIAGLYVNGGSGELKAHADNNANILAGVIANQGSGNISLTAKHDLNLGTLQELSATSIVSSRGNFSWTGGSDEVGSQVVGQKNVVLTAGHDINAREVSVDAAGLLLANADNDFNIAAGRTTQETHGKAQSSYSKGLTKITSTVSADHEEDLSQASTFTGGLVTLSTGNNLTAEGVQIHGDKGVAVLAGGLLDIHEARDLRTDSIEATTKKKGIGLGAGSLPLVVPISEAERDKVDSGSNTAAVSRIGSEGGVIIQGGAVALQGVQIDAGRDLTVRGDQVAITGATDYTSSSAEHYQKNLNAGSETWYRDAGTGINAKRTDTHEEQRSDVVRSELSGANVSILAKSADGQDGSPGKLGELTLSGTTITTPGTLTLEADNLHLASQQSEKSVSDTSAGRDVMWQKNSGQGSSDQTTEYNQLNFGTLALNANHVQADLGARDSLEALGRQPGMGWVNQLQNDPELSSKVDWKRVEEAHEQWDYKQQGLTPEGAAIVTAVVTYFTAGAASQAGLAAGEAVAATAGATAGTVVSGAVSAGLSTLAAQAAVALIDNKGNLGKTLDDLGSSQSVRNLVAATLTGGVLAALKLNPLGLPTESAGAQGFVSQLGQNLQAGTARAIIDTVINGGSLEDRLESYLKTALLDTVAAQGAFAIGKNFEPGSLANALAHAIAGCAVGAARTGGSCEAGALGAAVGELAANQYDPLATNQDDTVAFAAMVSAIAAAAAGLSADEINQASQAGANAAANNLLGLNDEVNQRIAGEKARLYAQCGASCTQADFDRIDLQAGKFATAANLAALATRKTLTTEQAQQLAQTLIELAPFYGNAESLAQFVTGRSTLTGEEASRFWSGVGLIPIAGGVLKKVGEPAVDAIGTILRDLKNGEDRVPPKPQGGSTIKPEDINRGQALGPVQGDSLREELKALSQVAPDTSRDAYYLANTDASVITDNRLAIDHVLAGEINAKDKATGYHAELAANGTARIAPGATATHNANGTYEAPVQVYDAKKGGWVNKDRGSTFFPLDWSEARLNYEVTEAFKNSAKSSQWAGQRGSSPSGVVIQFFWDQKNQRTTFYPLGK